MSDFLSRLLEPESEDEGDKEVHGFLPIKQKCFDPRRTSSSDDEDNEIVTNNGDVIQDVGGQDEVQYEDQDSHLHQDRQEANGEGEGEEDEDEEEGVEEVKRVNVNLENVQPDIFNNVFGKDGKFAIIRDAMTVPGLDVAVNVLTPDAYAQILTDDSFSLPTTDFVPDQKYGRALQRTNLSSDIDSFNSWSPIMWQFFNTVRDSGLYTEAAIPAGAYILHYPPDSEFPLHFDSRFRWGEYVCIYSLCAPVLLRFQWAKNKSVGGPKPVNLQLNTAIPSGDAHFMEPLPQNSYYRQAWGCHPHSKSKNPKVNSYVVEMVLPPNSMYVMRGDAHMSWRHGLKSLQSRSNQEDERNPRRAIVFREVKIFNVLSLEAERKMLQERLKASTGKGSAALNRELTDLQDRLDNLQDRLDEFLKYDTVTEGECSKCNRLLEILLRPGKGSGQAYQCGGVKTCSNKDCKEKFNPKRQPDKEVMQTITAAFEARQQRLKENPLHQVRFRPEEVQFPDEGQKFGPGDPFADIVHEKTKIELEALYYPPGPQRLATGTAAAASASFGSGARLGGAPTHAHAHAPATAAAAPGAFPGSGRRLGGGTGGTGRGGGQGQRSNRLEEDSQDDLALQQALLASRNDGGGWMIDDEEYEVQLKQAKARSLETNLQKRRRSNADMIDLT